MRRLTRHGIVLAACGATAAAAWGQLNIPTIVQLPTSDFVWPWGELRPIDDAEKPEFTMSGGESSFQCQAKGSFKPGSRMRDYYALREFEQSLTGSIYFIQDVTARFNDLYVSNDLQWALLECIIPETVEPEDEIQERVDRAVERAERERERRRERAASEE